MHSSPISRGCEMHVFKNLVNPVNLSIFNKIYSKYVSFATISVDEKKKMVHLKKSTFNL